MSRFSISISVFCFLLFLFIILPSFLLFVPVAISFGYLLLSLPDTNVSFKYSLGGIIGFSFLLFYLINSYTNPSEESLSNTDHTFLEHKGWTFSESLKLASKDPSKKEGALFSHYSADLSLHAVDSSYQLKSSSSLIPIYTASPAPASKRVFQLSNLLNEPALKDQFTIKFQDSKDTLTLLFKETPCNKSNTKCELSLDTIKSDLKRPIKYGYPLIDLLASYDKNLNPRMDSLLSGSHLIRANAYYDTDYYKDTPTSEWSPFILVPGEELLKTKAKLFITNSEGTFSGDDLFQYEEDMPVEDEGYFYFGYDQKGGQIGEVWKVDQISNVNSNDTINRLTHFFAKKYALSKSDTSKHTSFFINTSKKDIVLNDYTGGYTYDYNTSDNYHFHVKANFKYRSGRANEKLKFLINDHNNIELGINDPIFQNENEEFHLKTSIPEVDWIFQFRNLRNEFSISPFKIILVLLYLAICLIALLYYQNIIVPNSPFRNQDKTHTNNVMFVCFSILLLFLIGFRLFLIWRIGTIPPIENITFKEFYALFNSGRFYETLGFCSFTLLNLLAFGKYENITWLIFGALSLLLFTGLGVATLLLPNLLLKLLCFAGIILIGYRIVKMTSLNDRLPNMSDDAVQKKLPLLTQVLTAMLGVLAIIAMASRGILVDNNTEVLSLVILLNILILFLWKMIPEISLKKLSVNLFFVILFSAIVAWRIDKGFMIPYALFQSVLLFLFYIPLLKPRIGRQQNSNRIFSKQVILSIGFGILVSALVILPKFTFTLASPLIELALGDKSTNFNYRLKVYKDELKDVASQTTFEKSDKQYFLWAAHNKWFITNYMLPINGAKPFSWNNRFKLQSHSDQGVSFITQTNDLISLRYIISEHTEFTLFMVIMAFLVLIFLYTIKMSEGNAYHFIGLVLLYMITLMSIVVWMTVTNRLVFFGQDFPFFSINARTFFLFNLLSLIFVFIAFINGETRSAYHPFAEDNTKKFYYAVPLLIALAITVSFLNDAVFGRYNDRVKATQNFSLSENIGKLRTIFNGDNNTRGLNAEFYDFQKNLRDNNDETSKTILSSPYETAKEFHTQNKEIFNQLLDEKSEFAKTLMANFFSKKYDEYGVIFIFTRNTGTYQFKVRPDYFDVPNINTSQETWVGSIRSANLSTGYKFKRNNETQEVNWNDPDRLPFGNINFYNIPSKFTSDNNPIFFIQVNKSNSKNDEYIISNDFFRTKPAPNLSSIPAEVKINDYISIIDQSRNLRKIQYQLNADNSTYLAKNVYLNGKENRKIYPFSEQNLWAYHITSSTSGHLNKVINNHLPISDKEDILKLKNYDVFTSIDFNLSEEIQSHFSIRRDIPYNQFSIAAMDGNGKIRLMYDRDNKAGDPILNPNSPSDFYSKLSKYDLAADTDEERRLIGNLNLMKMNPGPGSSFKPLVYSSVISGYNFNWKNLIIETDNSILNDVSLEDGIAYYGANKVSPFKTNDLINNSSSLVISPSLYIERSLNLYNSFLIYAGSLTKDEWEDTHNYVRGRSYGSGNFLTKNAKANHRFPKISISGNKFFLNKNSMPRENMTELNSESRIFTNVEGILPRYLNSNYSIPIDKDSYNYVVKDTSNTFLSNNTIYRQSITLADTSFNIDLSDYSNSLWAMPEKRRVSFYLEDRLVAGNTNSEFVTAAGLNNPTYGGEPVIMTPIKMAESALRLFSQNVNINYTVNEKEKNKEYLPFSYDDSYSESEYLKQIQQLIYKSMNKVTYTSIGTASWLGRTRQTINKDEIHVYAKTGTIGNQDNKDRYGGNKNLKAIMIILSRDALHNGELTSSRLEENKLFSMYLTFPVVNGINYSTAMQDHVKHAVKKVIESQSFNNYWYE